jgi:hypothetical protein
MQNYLILKAHSNKYLLLYLSPLLVLLIVLALQTWTTSNFTWEILNPPSYSLPSIPRCSG